MRCSQAELTSLLSVGRLGVLLDSGDVLIRAINGRWFPPPAFYDVLSQRGVRWEPRLLDEGLVAASSYLDDVRLVPLVDEQAERAVWIRYYEIALGGAGITKDCSALASAITEAWAWTYPGQRGDIEVEGDLRRAV